MAHALRAAQQQLRDMMSSASQVGEEGRTPAAGEEEARTGIINATTINMLRTVLQGMGMDAAAQDQALAEVTGVMRALQNTSREYYAHLVRAPHAGHAGHAAFFFICGAFSMAAFF